MEVPKDEENTLFAPCGSLLGWSYRLSWKAGRYLARQGLSEDWWDEIEKFEKEVIAKRN